MAKTQTSTRKITFGKRRNRPGVHAKTKNSRNPNSKNYKKKYRSQGR